MFALPVRREPAPLVARPVPARARAQAGPEPARPEPTSVTTARPASHDQIADPADAALAHQQQAFDQMLQMRAELEREANAVRELGMQQAKKENDFLLEWIRMI